MQKETKTRIIKFFFYVLIFIVEQYLRELFIYVHMIIIQSSPEKFAFVMILITAIVIALLKVKTLICEQES